MENPYGEPQPSAVIAAMEEGREGVPLPADIDLWPAGFIASVLNSEEEQQLSTIQERLMSVLRNHKYLPPQESAFPSMTAKIEYAERLIDKMYDCLTQQNKTRPDELSNTENNTHRKRERESEAKQDESARCSNLTAKNSGFEHLRIPETTSSDPVSSTEPSSSSMNPILKSIGRYGRKSDGASNGVNLVDRSGDDHLSYHKEDNAIGKKYHRDHSGNTVMRPGFYDSEGIFSSSSPSGRSSFPYRGGFDEPDSAVSGKGSNMSQQPMPSCSTDIVKGKSGHFPGLGATPHSSDVFEQYRQQRSSKYHKMIADSFTLKVSSTSGGDDKLCYICHQPGHFAKHCKFGIS